MKAAILLKTRPGIKGKEASLHLKKLSSQEGDIRVVNILHCFGRFDGVVICEYNHLSVLNEFAEKLRTEGVFNTETLIGIE